MGVAVVAGRDAAVGVSEVPHAAASRPMVARRAISSEGGRPTKVPRATCNKEAEKADRGHGHGGGLDQSGAKAVAEMIASPQDIPALPGLREVKV